MQKCDIGSLTFNLFFVLPYRYNSKIAKREITVFTATKKEYFLMDNDLKGLHLFAKESGFTESQEGYFSKCHLCMDIRRHLALKGDFRELQPKEFYRHLCDTAP